MVSEPSWGLCLGQGPLKWTEIGPTNDPWMISDEFETIGANHFWQGQTKAKIFVKKLFILYKSKIFIQNK